MERFRDTLSDCELFDVGYIGCWYTWAKGNSLETNIQERLDRGLATVSWLDCFPFASIRYLMNAHSDHCPLLVTTVPNPIRHQSCSFKFEAWWILKPSFEEEVAKLLGRLKGGLIGRLKEVGLGL